MPRYKLTLEYDGTPFVGWQIQADGISVQGSLVAAVEKFTGQHVEVRGAGRTDSGVHARGQVAHIDLDKDWSPSKIREALNHHLRPAPISIVKSEAVNDTFDARFSATRRHYLYRLLVRRAPPALERDRVWWIPQSLDLSRMREAAPHLIGQFDFTTFRAAGCQAKSPVKTLDQLEVSQRGDEIWINAAARSFLHHQVRSIVGCLKAVGAGKWTTADFIAARDARERSRCAQVAPAAGLYLMQVDYKA